MIPQQAIVDAKTAQRQTGASSLAAALVLVTRWRMATTQNYIDYARQEAQTVLAGILAGGGAAGVTEISNRAQFPKKVG